MKQYVVKTEKIPVQFPPQHQPFHPGVEWLMVPRPISEMGTYRATGKLKGKVAIISGGDSGIGRAIAYALVRKGQILLLLIKMSMLRHWKRNNVLSNLDKIA